MKIKKLNLDRLKIWDSSHVLAENEWLLKVDETYHSWKNDADIPLGFMTKLTQKEELPLAFKKWPVSHYGHAEKILPIYILPEIESLDGNLLNLELVKVKIG